jgi:hypothetical protein
MKRLSHWVSEKNNAKRKGGDDHHEAGREQMDCLCAEHATGPHHMDAAPVRTG